MPTINTASSHVAVQMDPRGSDAVTAEP
jgi:hypothetical protein